MKRIVFLTLLLALALLLAACGAPASDSAGSSAEAERSVPAESAPIQAGTYTDGAGDSLTLTLQENGGYRVDFGVCKLLWVEDAEGAREGDVLHFEGTDDGGNAFAADITAEGGGLLLTVAESGHLPGGDGVPVCPGGVTKGNGGILSDAAVLSHFWTSSRKMASRSKLPWAKRGISLQALQRLRLHSVRMALISASV